MTKLFIILAVISTCSAGVIPKDFSTSKQVLHSKSDNSDDNDWDNCFHKVQWRKSKSTPSHRKQKDKASDSGTRKNHLVDEFRNSLHGTDGKDLKIAFAESFVAYTNSGKDANQLADEFKNSAHEPKELKKSKIAESFIEYVDSSKDDINQLAKESRNFEHESEKLKKAKSFVEYSDSSKGRLNKLAKKFRNSVHGTDVKDSEKTEHAPSFVEYVDSNKDQRLLKTELKIHNINESTKENKLNEIFGSNLGLMETHLRNFDGSPLEKQTENLTPLQRTGKEPDKTLTFPKSFVEYADISDKQRSLKTEKQNKHELEIAEETLNETSDNFVTSVDHKLTDIIENELNKSNVDFQNSQVTEGDEAIKTKSFIESSVQNASSNETKESLEPKFQKQNIKELVTEVNNLNETTNTILDISENGLSKVHDINSDSPESDTAKEFSVIELVANAINASDVFEFLNLTDSLHFEVATENVSSEFFEMDETALMSEGSEIALFQDNLSTGFEFLIDAETTKNLILTELLRSENFVVTENGKIAFLEESSDSFPEIIEISELNAQENNDMEAIVIKTNDVAIPVEEKSNLAEVPVEIKVENHSTLINNLVDRTDSTDFLETVELNSTSLRNSTSFGAELSKVGKGTNLLDNESSIPELSEKICPEPGFCLIWFFAQDDCSDSTACHGSSICCKIGCSKTCIDV